MASDTASWRRRRHWIASAAASILFSAATRRRSSWHSRRTYRSIVVSYCRSCFSCCCCCGCCCYWTSRRQFQSRPDLDRRQSRDMDGMIEALTFTHGGLSFDMQHGAAATRLWFGFPVHTISAKRSFFFL